MWAYLVDLLPAIHFATLFTLFAAAIIAHTKKEEVIEVNEFLIGSIKLNYELAKEAEQKKLMRLVDVTINSTKLTEDEHLFHMIVDYAISGAEKAFLAVVPKQELVGRHGHAHGFVEIEIPEEMADLVGDMILEAAQEFALSMCSRAANQSVTSLRYLTESLHKFRSENFDDPDDLSYKEKFFLTISERLSYELSRAIHIHQSKLAPERHPWSDGLGGHFYADEANAETRVDIEII